MGRQMIDLGTLEAPVISDVSATPDVLRPPNHRFVQVAVTITCTTPVLASAT